MNESGLELKFPKRVSSRRRDLGFGRLSAVGLGLVLASCLDFEPTHYVFPCDGGSCERGNAASGGGGAGGGCPPVVTRGAVVVSQIYTQGGVDGGYANDFVELRNITKESAVLTGYSLQYAGASGSSVASDWNILPIPKFELEPGRFYLIQLGGQPGEMPLPSPDLTDSRPPGLAIDLSERAGKVALMSTQALIATGSVCPPGDQLVDLVGYGETADWYETSWAPAPGAASPPASITRRSSGCQDTNDNSADFWLESPPLPKNSRSSERKCE